MKRYIALIISIAFAFSLSAQVDSLCAVIDIDAVREAAMNKAGVDSVINELNAAYEAEYKKLQEAYNYKVRSYVRENKNMSDAIRLSRQTEITEAESRLAVYLQRYTDDINTRRKILEQPIDAQINAAVDAIVEEMGIKILLRKSALVRYAADMLDITDTVKQRLEL